MIFTGLSDIRFSAYSPWKSHFCTLPVLHLGQLHMNRSDGYVICSIAWNPYQFLCDNGVLHRQSNNKAGLGDRFLDDFIPIDPFPCFTNLTLEFHSQEGRDIDIQQGILGALSESP